MRIFFTLIIFLQVISSFGQDTTIQDIPFKDGKITYEKVLKIDGATAKELYRRTKSWGVNQFISQKDVLQNDDKEDGIIVYKAFVPELYTPAKNITVVQSSSEWKIWALYKIYVKDSKAKIVVTNIEYQEGLYSPLPVEPFFLPLPPSDFKGTMFLSKKKMDKYTEETQKQRRLTVEKGLVEILSSKLLLQMYLTGEKKSDTDF